MSEEKASVTLEILLEHQVIPRASRVAINKRSMHECVIALIYSSIIEQSDVIMKIVDASLGYHSYQILRSQMESTADIINLARDKAYLKHIELEHVVNTHKMLVAAKKGNPYLREVALRNSFNKELSDAGKRIRLLECKGAKQLKPSQKMKLAGMAEEYEAIYGLLSDHSHGGLSSLISRHFQETEKGFDIVAYSHSHDEDFEAVFSTSIDSILRASLAFHTFFSSESAQYFSDEIKKLG